MSRRGCLFVVSGPSGAGKGTVLQAALEKLPDAVFSVSCTTRAKRPGEVHGVHYFFVAEPEFQRMAENGEFLEYAGVHAKRYGTPAAYVEHMRNAGKDVVLDIDVQGARQVRAKCPDAAFVFIAPPSFEVLKARLVGRGTESPEQVALRLEHAAKEVQAAPEYDYALVNGDLEAAVEGFLEIVRGERRRCVNNKAELQAVIDTF